MSNTATGPKITGLLPHEVDALREAWTEYGHCIEWKDLHAVKTDRGCYAVLCWRTQEGNLSLAHMARAKDTPWEMQDDGMSPDITDAEWKSLRIEEDCDNFYIPGHAEYTRWG